MQKNKQTVLPYILLPLIVVLIGALILLNFTPPFSRDALIHHLAIPKLYLQNGGIYEIPDLIFSYYPMNLELLYLAALYFNNDILPKFIHMSFALATGYLIYRYLKPRLPHHYSLLGALFFLSIPIIVKLSITVYVDLGLIFFTTASLLLLFNWIEKHNQIRYLAFAGLCCGLAVGTKYNGLIVLLLLTSLVPVLYLRSADSDPYETSPAIRAALLFLVCALVVASPWLIRNAIWTGNPIYPLYNDFFSPGPLENTIVSNEVNSIRGVFATRHALYGENIWQLLSLPVRIFFEGLDDDPRYFDGRLNPFLLLLPLFAFIQGETKDKKIQIEQITLLVFCLLYFLFAFNSGTLRIRYMAPLVPFLVILTIFGLHNIERKAIKFLSKPHMHNIVWYVPVILMLAYNGRYIYQQFIYVAPMSYISGKVTHTNYIAKYRPEYKVMQYANSNLPETAKILCVFTGHRGYYLNRTHVFDNYNNKNLLLSWTQEPNMSTLMITNLLKQYGISHIILRTDLFTQRINQQSLSAVNQQALADFFNHKLILLNSYLNYSLYKITDQ
ncbi:ArnT family glycosyltransferase [Desulforhopalus sp. 52FAK]